MAAAGRAGRAGIRALRGLLLISLCVAGPCLAARMALLVGVSQYPGLPPELQLKAPANDVRLMRQVLLQRGFEATHIEVLADGVEGAGQPTQAAIVAALQRLAVRARVGDIVYLHFSGHGSLQWTGASASTTPPQARQWQPVFLPSDVRGWDGKVGAPVPNAMPDTLLRNLVDRINDAGAFVFALFDACHSARLVRGALPGTDGSQLRVRQVVPAVLGLPGDPPPDVWPDWVVRPDATARSGALPGGPGRAVYFYAAQSVEQAATQPLSSGGEPVWHGLFTWHVAQALSLGQPMTYRQLGQHVLSRYDRLPASTATPLFSGDGMDQAVFGQPAAVLRQWMVQREQGRLTLPAGALAGLAEGALLALLSDPLAPATASPTQPPAGTLGFVRVVTVQASQSLLEPVAWQGWAPPSAQTLPAGAWARLLVNPPSFALRVTTERVACRANCLAGRALAQLQRDGVPGVDVHWVGANDSTDARLRATDTGMRLLMPGAAESGDGSWGFAVPAGEEALAVEVLAQEVAGALHRVARTRNLLRLAAGMALRAPLSDVLSEVQLTLKLRRSKGGVDTLLQPPQLSVVEPGDMLLLDGRNGAGDPVDLAAFWLGADQSIRQVYPADRRDSARLPGGARFRPRAWRIDPGTEGTERLLVLMMPMKKTQEVSDFRFLEQSPLSRLRSAGDPALQALLDACFADYAVRGEAAPALPAEQLGLRLFTFQIRP